MSDSSVITKEEGWLKRGCNSNFCRLRFAICNPELTFTLPWSQVASGATDILMHTLERWFDNARTSTELTDAIAISLFKTVMRNALILKNNPKDYNAAAEMMWAGSLSHNGLTGCGGSTPAGDWSCHQLEHELGGMFDVTHGAGLSAVWGSWARYVSKVKPERFVKLGKDLFGTEDIEKMIKSMEDFFVSIDMPINIKSLGVTPTDEQIKELAWKCSFFGKRKVGFFHPLELQDLEAIFNMAKK
jgi:alcohol dehydrogenase YqhD (iron-dependent ADH family)